MPAPSPCAFCATDSAAAALWHSEHYCVLPDAFPRCAGHVLLVTRQHLPSHMHAPENWMAEFRAAQALVRTFLTTTFGGAAFYENGGARQAVPHAHLHGLPFAPTLPARWRENGRIRAIDDWADARAACRRDGHYFYLETDAGAFLIRDYKHVLNRVRSQLIDQTEARLLPDGKMARGDSAMVERTRLLWRQYTAALINPSDPPTRVAPAERV